MIERIKTFSQRMPKIYPKVDEFDFSKLESMINPNAHFTHFCKDSDGVKYHGLTDDQGRKDGVGMSVNSDGRVYEGGWAENLYHGPGRLIDEENTVIIGVWEQGHANG